MSRHLAIIEFRRVVPIQLCESAARLPSIPDIK